MARRKYWGLVILIFFVVTVTVWFVLHNNAEIERIRQETSKLLPHTPPRVSDSADYQPPPLGETDDTGYWEGNTWHQNPTPKPKKRGLWSADPDTLANRMRHGYDLSEKILLARRIIREYPYSEAAIDARYKLMRYDENNHSRYLGHEGKIEYLKGMLKYHPNSPRVLSDLAMRLDMDSPEEAIAFSQKSLRIDPSNRDAHAALGTAYQRLGNYKSALVHLKAAQKLSDPNEPSMVEIIIDENTSFHNAYDRFTYEISMIEAGTPRYGPDPPPRVSSPVDVPLVSSEVVPTPPPVPASMFDPLSVSSDMSESSSAEDRVSDSSVPLWRDDLAVRARESVERARSDYERRRREEFDSFMRWMAQIEAAQSPADLEDFLMREMAQHLQGGTSDFTPERLIRAFETMLRQGEIEGMRHLQKQDAEMARAMARHPRSKPNKSPNFR